MESKRTRASKPKVRTGCFTCKARRVKCDEEKPACKRCKSTGRHCDGYARAAPTQANQQSGTSSSQWTALMPRQMSHAPAETVPGEPRALEFFFHKSAPQLAGFFERAFWKGSVLQSSLAEPAIRQAIAAIAVLHEQQGRSTLLGSGESDNDGSSSSSSSSSESGDNAAAVRLYNKAIRQIVDRTRMDPDAVPMITMASVLFTCFEFLRGDATTAEAHIANGVRLLQSWRDRNNGRPLGPWGRSRSYAHAWTSATQFMETELAPILSLFNMNTWEFGPGNHRQCKFGLGQRSRILLNGLDPTTGQLLFPDRFESLREARIGIVDLVTLCAIHFQAMDERVLQQGPLSDEDMQGFWAGIRANVEHWKSSFDALLVRRRQYPDYCASSTADENETPAAETVLRIMWFSITLGMSTYCLPSECAWDNQRDSFEEILLLAETLVTDPSLYPDHFSRTLSLDLGLIFPLHAVAWKCRYPGLRRKGLDLLHRIPKREWLFDAERFHGLLERIMEIEQPPSHSHTDTGNYADTGDAHTGDAHTGDAGEGTDPITGRKLPPERCRVRDFFAMPIPTPPSFATLVPKHRALHRVTFEMAGTNPATGTPDQLTEYLWLPSPPNVVNGENAEPVTNMLSCKQWARPDFTDGASVDILRQVVFGGEGGRFIGSPSCTSGTDTSGSGSLSGSPSSVRHDSAYSSVSGRQ